MLSHFAEENFAYALRIYALLQSVGCVLLTSKVLIAECCKRVKVKVQCQYSATDLQWIQYLDIGVGIVHS
jgi:hypothetical protein